MFNFLSSLNIFTLILLILIVIFFGFIPVSYTHLDVYKRQGLMF